MLLHPGDGVVFKFQSSKQVHDDERCLLYKCPQTTDDPHRTDVTFIQPGRVRGDMLGTGSQVPLGGMGTDADAELTHCVLGPSTTGVTDAKSIQIEPQRFLQMVDPHGNDLILCHHVTMELPPSLTWRIAKNPNKNTSWRWCWGWTNNLSKQK